MCQSKAEGGQRCYSHLSKRHVKAREKLASLPKDASPAERTAAQGKYETAVAELAGHATGRVRLRSRLDAIESGHADLDGDDLDVLRRYAPHPPTPGDECSLEEALATREQVRVEDRPRSTGPVTITPGPYAVSLREAMATGKPMREEDRGPRPSNPTTPTPDWARGMRAH